MTPDFTAHATITIDAIPARIWDALTDPDAIYEYMFGAAVETDWRVGSPITWTGSWQGKSFEDKGTILRFDEKRVLQYSHYSATSGESEKPQDFHTVTLALRPDGDATHVDLAQDGNRNEAERRHAEEQWSQMLAGLKRFVEA